MIKKKPLSKSLKRESTGKISSASRSAKKKVAAKKIATTKTIPGKKKIAAPPPVPNTKPPRTLTAPPPQRVLSAPPPPSASPSPPPSSASSELETQIGDLERELVRIIDEAKNKPAPDDAPPLSEAALPSDDSSVLETARDLFSTDFYLRKWSRIGMRDRSEEVDDFGYDPVYEKKVGAFLRFLHDKYFRVESIGIDNVPREGRCLLVSNHSGTVPFDGVMLKIAIASHENARQVRWLVEDLVFHFPFLGSVITRLGGVRACPENAERLLGNDALVAVFPEGNKGIGKLFRERYQLQRFGRGGFIKLCLRTRTPIVPVAIVGGEETNPMLGRFELFARALGIPYIPITPTFPWLGPAGLIPAPTKWKMHFGEPIDLSEHPPESADDDVLVARLAERVRASIQAMLDKAVGERKGVFFS